jgi:hypothetical protein
MSLIKQLAEKIPENLKPKEWVSAVHVGFQQQLLTFLIWATGLSVVVTVVCIFLQGFHLWGFVLESSFLRWLGGATIGEIGVLLTIALRASFK